MGLFDTITFDCPHCGARNSEQTKSGDPMMHEWDIYRAPVAALGGIAGPRKCEYCDQDFSINIKVEISVVRT